MRTKLTGAGLSILGIGVGAALGILQMGSVTVAGWLMLVLLIPSASMAVAGVLLVMVEMLSPDNEPVSRKAAELSRELLEFLAERRRDDPSQIPHWFGLPQNASESRRRRAFERSTEAMILYSNETMSRYALRYQARALKLFDDLVARGLIDLNQRHRFEHPTNLLGIEEVAKALGIVGEGGKTTTNRSVWHKLAS